jgi:hypothetical protein
VLGDSGVIVINPRVDHKVYLRFIKNGINTNTFLANNAPLHGVRKITLNGQMIFIKDDNYVKPPPRQPK